MTSRSNWANDGSIFGVVPADAEDVTAVKSLGQRLGARDFDSQVAEFHVRVAIRGGFTALGMPITKVAG